MLRKNAPERKTAHWDTSYQQAFRLRSMTDISAIGKGYKSKVFLGIGFVLINQLPRFRFDVFYVNEGAFIIEKIPSTDVNYNYLDYQQWKKYYKAVYI